MKIGFNTQAQNTKTNMNFKGKEFFCKLSVALGYAKSIAESGDKVGFYDDCGFYVVYGDEFVEEKKAQKEAENDFFTIQKD